MVTYPSDWNTYPFKKMFRLIPNNPLSRDKLTNSGSIGNIHYGDVLIKYGDTISDQDNIPRIKGNIDFVASNLLQKNDVIIADTAEDETVGKVTQVGDVSIPLVGGLHTVICRPNIETADGYLGCYMNSRYYHDQLLPYITGIKVSSVSKKSLNETELTIPSTVDEQQEIIKVFHEMDQHIDNLSMLIEKKRGIRDGALEDLISGRTRVIGYNSEWKAQKLCDLAYILNGDRGVNYPNENQFIPFGIPFVNAGNLENGRVNWDNMNYITEDRYNLLGGGKIKKGDILFCLRGSLGKYALVNFSGGAPASSLCIIRAKENTVPSFLLYIIASSLMRNNIEMTNTGSSQPNLSAKDISHYIFEVPADIDEQNEIANILIAMDEEIEVLEAEREKMIQIREGAMDDLLTGRVRLKV